MPVYQEEDFIISDSSVICAYLEKQYPDNPIYPSNSKFYAQCLWYEEYVTTYFMPTISTIFLNTCLAEKFNLKVDHNAVKNAVENLLPAIFSYLDNSVYHKEYLVDEKLTLADIAISVGFLNLEFAGYLLDPKKWPSLSKYLNAINKNFILEASTEAKEIFYKSAKQNSVKI